MEVRAVRPEELEAAGRLCRAAYEEFFEGTADSAYLDDLADTGRRATRATVLVALEGDALVGTVTLELRHRIDRHPRRDLDEDEAHLRMLAVPPGGRRLGVGRALVDACVSLARAAGKRRITLNTMPEMVAAQGLYDSMGFRRSGQDSLPSGFCMVSYELEMASPDRAG